MISTFVPLGTVCVTSLFESPNLYRLASEITTAYLGDEIERFAPETVVVTGFEPPPDVLPEELLNGFEGCGAGGVYIEAL
jgi:hypothetical protein